MHPLKKSFGENQKILIVEGVLCLVFGKNGKLLNYSIIYFKWVSMQ